MSEDLSLDDELVIHRPEDQLNAMYPLQHYGLNCIDCGAALVLKRGRFGIFYGCTQFRETGCEVTQNCHQNDAKPYGRPASAKTKAARKEVREWVERLLTEKHYPTLPSVYSWLREELGTQDKEFRLSYFDEATCKRVTAAVKHKLGELTRFDREVL